MAVIIEPVAVSKSSMLIRYASLIREEGEWNAGNYHHLLTGYRKRNSQVRLRMLDGIRKRMAVFTKEGWVRYRLLQRD